MFQSSSVDAWVIGGKVVREENHMVSRHHPSED